MDYKRIYKEIIENRRENKFEGYVEKHHIKPKCLDGDDSEDNLVSLSAREHFLCHWLLCKIHPEDDRLAYAFNAMTTDAHGNRYSTKSYKYARERFAKAHSRNMTGKLVGRKNHMHGKSLHDVWTEKHGKDWADKRLEEYKNNMRDTVLGDKNGFYGKTHNEDTKDKIRKAKYKNIKITFPDGTIKEELTTLDEIAKKYNLHMKTVYRYCNKGKIPYPKWKNPTQDKINCVGFEFEKK